MDEEIYLVDAGHTKTIHFQAVSNTVCLLEGQNLPLGLDEKELYYQIKFDIGDTLFFYSDGFIDARNENKIHFGANALAQLIKNIYLSKNLSKKIKDKKNEFPS